VSEGYVYVGSGDTHVYCLNAATGVKEWDYETGDDVSSSPAVSGGYVYVGSYDNKAYCLNAATGDTGEWPMFKSNPERTGAN
jgi:outer membrane protein assembly factor BamB